MEGATNPMSPVPANANARPMYLSSISADPVDADAYADAGMLVYEIEIYVEWTIVVPP